MRWEYEWKWLRLGYGDFELPGWLRKGYPCHHPSMKSWNDRGWSQDCMELFIKVMIHSYSFYVHSRAINNQEQSATRARPTSQQRQQQQQQQHQDKESSDESLTLGFGWKQGSVAAGTRGWHVMPNITRCCFMPNINH